MEVYVFGAERKDVQQAVEGFERGLSTSGHGGYRISYEIEEREIDIEETIRQEERTKNKLDIEELNSKIGELEQKWSKERKEFETEIEVLRDDNKKLQKKLQNIKTKPEVKKEEISTEKIRKEKPGIISRFANWVFIKARPFKSRKKTRKEIKPTKKNIADNVDSEMWYDYVTRILGDLDKLKEIGEVYCLYGGELNHIIEMKNNCLKIVASQGISEITIEVPLEQAEILIARFKLIEHLKAKYNINQTKNVKKILEKLVKNKKLTRVKRISPRYKKAQIFIGLGKD